MKKQEIKKIVGEIIKKKLNESTSIDTKKVDKKTIISQADNKTIPRRIKKVYNMIQSGEFSLNWADESVYSIYNSDKGIGYYLNLKKLTPGMLLVLEDKD